VKLKGGKIPVPGAIGTDGLRIIQIAIDSVLCRCYYYGMDKSLHDTISAIAQGVRYWAEAKSNRDDLSGWCAKCSAELHRRLEKEGIYAEIHLCDTEWGSHVYLVVEDHIVDVTATQFSSFYPDVMIRHQREMDGEEFFTTTETFKSVDKLRELQKKNKWPSYQIAYSR